MHDAAAAFAEPFIDAEFEHERMLWEPDRLIGAVDGETWVGTGGAYSFRLTVPGGEVGAAGITVIAVTPSHRRRGILRQMMRWLLDQARERGEPVSVLWASESAIYQRFGYMGSGRSRAASISNAAGWRSAGRPSHSGGYVWSIVMRRRG